MASTRAEVGARNSGGERNIRRPNGARASARARQPRRRPAPLAEPEPNPPDEPAGATGTGEETGGAWLGEPPAIGEVMKVPALVPERNRANGRRRPRTSI